MHSESHRPPVRGYSSLRWPTLACALFGILALSALSAEAAPLHRRSQFKYTDSADKRPFETVLVFTQQQAAIFWLEPFVTGGNAPTMVLGYSPSEFATQYLYWEPAEDSNVEGTVEHAARIRTARKANVLLNHLGVSFDDQVASGLAGVLKSLSTIPRVGEIRVVERLDEAGIGVVRSCIATDHCLLATVRWGFTNDAAHLDAEVSLQVWSASLREAGEKPSKWREAGANFFGPRMPLPDAYTLVLARSEPMALANPKTDADREALRAAARSMYEQYDIDGLLEMIRSGVKADAIRARQKADPMMKDLNRLNYEIKAKKWKVEDARHRRMQLWAESGSEPARAALTASFDQLAALLPIALDDETQKLKATLNVTRMKKLEIAHVLEEGPRRLVFLHDGTLASVPKGPFHRGQYTVFHEFDPARNSTEDSAPE